MNLIILEPEEVDPRGFARLTDERARHALTQLKVGAGQQVRVGLVDGPRGVGVVQSIQNGILTILCSFDTRIPPRPMVDLLMALPRPKVMRRLWAQLAALGVDRIILTNAARVERHYFDTHLLAPESYRPLLIEGLQQARDTRLPRVAIHRRLKVLVEDELGSLCDRHARLLADPSAETTPVAAILERARLPQVLVAVGPEGGWNEYERDLFAAHGFDTVSLGPRTLRTDTACIALLAVVSQALSHRTQVL